jgi:hypothetical protein
MAYSHAMVSPLIDAGNATNVTFAYDVSLDDYDMTGDEKLNVDVWNGTGWTTLNTLTNNGNIAWTNYVHNITTYATAGLFNVRFRAYGADSWAVDYWYIDNVKILPINVGIEQIASSDIRIFPNPASDMITIQATEEINSVTVLNYAGQVIQSSEVNARETSLNSSNWSSGIYFIKIETANGTQMKRISVR